MPRRRGGLQKNVRSIFEDASLPDDVSVHVVLAEPDMEPEPTCVPASREKMTVPDVSAGLSPCESVPEMAVAEAPPETSLSPEEPDFSDPVIEARMKKQKCEKDFSCYTSGLKELCQARVTRGGKAVQCMEPKKTSCAYRMTTLFKRICQCPIRIHIAKKHGK